MFKDPQGICVFHRIFCRWTQLRINKYDYEYYILTWYVSKMMAESIFRFFKYDHFWHVKFSHVTEVCLEIIKMKKHFPINNNSSSVNNWQIVLFQTSHDDTMHDSSLRSQTVENPYINEFQLSPLLESIGNFWQNKSDCDRLVQSCVPKHIKMIIFEKYENTFGRHFDTDIDV